MWWEGQRESERERESDRRNGNRWRKVRNAQRSSFNEKGFFYSCFSLNFFLISPPYLCSALKDTVSLSVDKTTIFFLIYFPVLSSLLFQHLCSSPQKKTKKNRKSKFVTGLSKDTLKCFLKDLSTEKQKLDMNACKYLCNNASMAKVLKTESVELLRWAGWWL